MKYSFVDRLSKYSLLSRNEGLDKINEKKKKLNYNFMLKSNEIRNTKILNHSRYSMVRVCVYHTLESPIEHESIVVCIRFWCWWWCHTHFSFTVTNDIIEWCDRVRYWPKQLFMDILTHLIIIIIIMTPLSIFLFVSFLIP